MRITESRLRRVIRQVIKESMSIHSDLKAEIMSLVRGLTPYSLEHQLHLEDQLLTLDQKYRASGLMDGDLYREIAEACESAPGLSGSRDAEGGVIACLQSDQAEAILDQAFRSLGLH